MSSPHSSLHKFSSAVDNKFAKWLRVMCFSTFPMNLLIQSVLHLSQTVGPDRSFGCVASTQEAQKICFPMALFAFLKLAHVELNRNTIIIFIVSEQLPIAPTPLFAVLAIGSTRTYSDQIIRYPTWVPCNSAVASTHGDSINFTKPRVRVAVTGNKVADGDNQ
jgi:hypothetical protein